MYYLITKYIRNQRNRMEKRYYTGVRRDASGMKEVTQWGPKRSALRIREADKAYMIARHLAFAKVVTVLEKGDEKADEES